MYPWGVASPESTSRRLAFIRYVIPAIVCSVGSIIVARWAQAPRNTRGAAGYAVLADRVNKLEFEVEFLASHSQPAPVQVPVAPLQRVPSQLAHLP